MKFLLVIFGVGLVGCATLGVGAADPTSVKVMDKVDSYSCKFVALVSGTFSSPWDSADNMAEGAMKDARSQAAALGADTVVLQGSPQMDFNSEARRRESSVTVNAYTCKKK